MLGPLQHCLQATSAMERYWRQVPEVVAPRDKETTPRAILRVEGGTVIYGVHLNSSGLGFCRAENASAALPFQDLVHLHVIREAHHVLLGK